MNSQQNPENSGRKAPVYLFAVKLCLTVRKKNPSWEKIFFQLGRYGFAVVISFFGNYCMNIRHKYAL